MYTAVKILRAVKSLFHKSEPDYVDYIREDIATRTGW